jgi:hypothetical protein
MVELPAGFVAFVAELLVERRPVVVEHRIEKAPDILEHDHLGLTLSH